MVIYMIKRPSELKGRVDILVANAPYVPTEAIAMLPQELQIIRAYGGTRRR